MRPIARPFLAHLLALLLLALVPLTQAAAQQVPDVNALQLDSDARLDPGAQLQLRLEGTPRGRASIRIANTNIVVPLRETAPGVYRGVHTVRRTDRIDPTGVMRATLTVGNQTTTHNFAFPPAFVALARQPEQQARTSPAPQAQPQAAARIDRFEARPDGPLEPGTQVRFILEGAPGGTASINVPGLARDLALRELRPGHYRGTYTLRREDKPAALASAAATLRLSNQVVSANLTEPLALSRNPAQVLGSQGPLPLQVLSPANNATIDTGVTELRGRTAPNAEVRVKIDAVPPLIGQRLGVAQQLLNETVKADAQGNFSVRLDPRGLPIPGTRYEVLLSVGNGAQASETRLVLLQRG